MGKEKNAATFPFPEVTGLHSEINRDGINAMAFLFIESSKIKPAVLQHCWKF